MIYTSALSVGLAIEFVAIIAGVAVVKLIDGSIEMPCLMPELINQASKIFTTILILVIAYIWRNYKVLIVDRIFLFH